MSVRPKDRFEVFKRDGFTCQYCGRKPPEVVLECDHIEPQAEGGDDRIGNLITACRSCNRGKGPVPLESEVPNAVARAREQEMERARQVDEYNTFFMARREQLEANVNHVVEYWERHADWVLEDDQRNGVRRFLNDLPLAMILEACDIAFAKRIYNDRSRFRYFCGVCWKKIRGETP